MSEDEENIEPAARSSRDMGPQPLDAVMIRLGLSNHDVVAAAAPEPLTHKAVARARRGRRLTERMQRKVLAALNRAVRQRDPDAPALSIEEAFSYRADHR